MKIQGLDFSERGSVFIIAELSANHKRNLETAIATIKAAKYRADAITVDGKKEDFKIKGSTHWDVKYPGTPLQLNLLGTNNTLPTG